MTSEEYIRRRNNYSYPTIGLKGSLNELEQIQFPSTFQFDEYQRSLLTHEKEKNVVLGYLSTIFWGHYSGQNKIERPSRAMGKMRLARDGFERVRNGRNERIKGVMDYGVNTVATALRNAHGLLSSDKCAEAIEVLCLLPQLQIAFASKICAFLVPEKCGVIDSIIAKKFPQFCFSIDKIGIVKNTKTNRNNYLPYCEYLQENAAKLNALGSNFHWTDRDNVRHPWRALDVERAMY